MFDLTHLRQCARRCCNNTALAIAIGIMSIMPVHAQAQDDLLIQTIKTMEARMGARIGVAINDVVKQRSWTYRADEPFPITSTFKAFACAAALARVDAGQDALARGIPVQEAMLVDYSPVTEKFIGDEITLAQACHATITMSDNTAGNIVLDSIGGPAGFTQFMRDIGDQHSRLDRRETALNEATPGDPRDTTTPAAAAHALQTLLLTEKLTPASRAQLEDWMINDAVAGALLRRSLPKDWVIGDKTGAGGFGSRSIIALIRIPGHGPVIVAIYLTQSKASMEARNAAIADIGSALVKSLTVP
jgi:beta-lactamase class A